MTDPETVETYQSVADEYGKRHADRSTVEEQVERFLTAVEETTARERARIVDVGCGPGWESSTFSAHGHVGADLTPTFLRSASERVSAAYSE